MLDGLIKLKNCLPYLELNPDRWQPRACQPSRHCGLLTAVLSPLSHLDRPPVSSFSTKFKQFRQQPIFALW